MSLSRISIPQDVPMAFDGPRITLGTMHDGQVCLLVHYGHRIARAFVGDDELDVRQQLADEFSEIIRANRLAIHMLLEV